MSWLLPLPSAWNARTCVQPPPSLYMAGLRRERQQRQEKSAKIDNREELVVKYYISRHQNSVDSAKTVEPMDHSLLNTTYGDILRRKTVHLATWSLKMSFFCETEPIYVRMFWCGLLYQILTFFVLFFKIYIKLFTT